MATNYVYLIGHPESCMYKVGVSNNPKRRFQAIQAHSPVMLLLIAIKPCGDTAYQEERRLHLALSRFRHHGEWFKLTKDHISALFTPEERIITFTKKTTWREALERRDEAKHRAQSNYNDNSPQLDYDAYREMLRQFKADLAMAR
jgi:hypothetical protein